MPADPTRLAARTGRKLRRNVCSTSMSRHSPKVSRLCFIQSEKTFSHCRKMLSACHRLAILLNRCGRRGQGLQGRIAVGEKLIADPQRMHAPQPFGTLFGGKGADDRLRRGAVETVGYLGQTGHGGKAALLVRRVAAQGANVVKGSAFEPGDVVSGHQSDIGRIR